MENCSQSELMFNYNLSVEGDGRIVPDFCIENFIEQEILVDGVVAVPRCLLDSFIDEGKIHAQLLGHFGRTAVNVFVLDVLLQTLLLYAFDVREVEFGVRFEYLFLPDVFQHNCI